MFFTKLVKANILAFIKTKNLRPVLSVKTPPSKNVSPCCIVQWLVCYQCYQYLPTKNVFQSFRDYQKWLGWTSFPSLTNSVDFALGSAWCLLFSFSSGSPSNFAGIANLCALLCIISGHWSVPIYSVFLLLMSVLYCASTQENVVIGDFCFLFRKTKVEYLTI